MKYFVKKNFTGKSIVKFECPGCGVSLREELSKAGAQDRCPACNCQFTLPGVKEKASLERKLAADKEERLLKREKKLQERERVKEEVRAQKNVEPAETPLGELPVSSPYRPKLPKTDVPRTADSTKNLHRDSFHATDQSTVRSTSLNSALVSTIATTFLVVSCLTMIDYFKTEASASNAPAVFGAAAVLAPAQSGTSEQASDDEGTSDSYNQAVMAFKHGLKDDAKRICISVIGSEAESEEKSQAYYLLGLIAFDEKRIADAAETWRELKKRFPDSQSAKTVSSRLDELSEVMGESIRGNVDNALASSYLAHGDFWSRGKDTVFSIDSSWISNFDAALKWYDKVISDFPGTPAAQIAYQEKMRVLLGWEDSRGRETFGVKRDFEKHITPLIATFEEYEREFPDAGQRQAFRYQIAQAYWSNKDFKNAETWLQLIARESVAGGSFYSDLAARRLENLEY